MLYRFSISAGRATLLAAAIVISGCSGESAQAPETGPAAPTAQIAREPGAPKNCLLILLDAFHAGHCSHLGYERETTPYLDALARNGVSFSRAYAQCPNTLGSTVSYMTGRYLPQPQSEGVEYTLGSDHTTLAEMFQRSGFATAGYSENPYVHPSGKFDRGFDEFQVKSALAPKQADKKFRGRDEAAATELLKRANAWIEQQIESPWFCYVHLLRPHDPYFSPGPFAGRFRAGGDAPDDPELDLEIMWKRRWRNATPTADELQYVIDVYDGSIAYVDAMVGGFLDGLRATGNLDDTLIVVYSDHGEAFMQHGEFKHNTTVYDEMIHVPFVFIPPAGSEWALGTREDVVELVDLYPTLADVFGLARPDGLHGESLVPLLEGQAAKGPTTVYTQTVAADRVAYRYEADKLIFWKSDSGLGISEWFNLDDDPGEQRNLLPSGAPPDPLVQAAKAIIDRYHVPAGEATVQLDSEQTELLRSLGYVE